jgi:hypothetical protein
MVGNLMKFSTTFIWTPRSDSVANLMKNKAQQKLFQIPDCAETLTCDSYISQTRSDKKVILVEFEKYLNLVSLIKIS